MTFDEAARAHAALRQRRDTGQLTEAQFREMAAQLMVLDDRGAYWMLDADSGQWMMYDGAQWITPGATGQAAMPPSPIQAAEPAPQAQEAPSAAPRRGFSWGQMVWDVLSVAGGAAMAAVWYWYSGMAETAPDRRTCIAMVVMPIALIALRKPLDALLRPIQPFRSKIPPMVLAGVGVAIPFLIANYLYSRGESQFPFMFKTYVYSTIASYLVLRTPAAARTIAPPPVMQ
jgi:hypothetical protein